MREERRKREKARRKRRGGKKTLIETGGRVREGGDGRKANKEA